VAQGGQSRGSIGDVLPAELAFGDLPLHADVRLDVVGSCGALDQLGLEGVHEAAQAVGADVVDEMVHPGLLSATLGRCDHPRGGGSVVGVRRG
jgi:hypothetical protein